MARRIVTPERKRVLESLATYHFMTTEQLYETVLPASGTPTQERAVRRLMLLMQRAGYVTRSRLVLDRPRDPFLRYTYSYRLTAEGLAALRDPRLRLPSASNSVGHDAEITRFHMNLRKAIAATDFRLWWRQTDLRQTVHPDALFAITDPARPRNRSTFYYFLEIEKSREGHYRSGCSGLEEKLRRYVAYRGAPRVREEWRHFTDFYVVVIVATDERRANLLQKLRGALPVDMIWIAAENDCAVDPGGRIFGAPSDAGSRLRSLFEAQHC
jgi:hypothetical protein